MIWIFITLLAITTCMILYATLGTILILKLCRWLWNAYKLRQLSKRTTDLSPGELWKIENKHLIENDEWDNSHHNENL